MLLSESSGVPGSESEPLTFTDSGLEKVRKAVADKKVQVADVRRSIARLGVDPGAADGQEGTAPLLLLPASRGPRAVGGDPEVALEVPYCEMIGLTSFATAKELCNKDKGPDAASSLVEELAMLWAKHTHIASAVRQSSAFGGKAPAPTRAAGGGGRDEASFAAGGAATAPRPPVE
jgi:hypothetical protein